MIVRENGNQCGTDGGIMQDKIGDAPNVWKIWDFDNEVWWEHHEFDPESAVDHVDDSWPSHHLASQAFELAYEQDPTSVPQFIRIVEFRLVEVAPEKEWQDISYDPNTRCFFALENESQKWIISDIGLDWFECPESIIKEILSSTASSSSGSSEQ
jgi:hypothetical protein